MGRLPDVVRVQHCGRHGRLRRRCAPLPPPAAPTHLSAGAIAPADLRCAVAQAGMSRGITIRSSFDSLSKMQTHIIVLHGRHRCARGPTRPPISKPLMLSIYRRCCRCGLFIETLDVVYVFCHTENTSDAATAVFSLLSHRQSCPTNERWGIVVCIGIVVYRFPPMYSSLTPGGLMAARLFHRAIRRDRGGYNPQLLAA